MYCETARHDRIEDYIDSLAVNVTVKRIPPRVPPLPAEDEKARTLVSQAYDWYQKANRLYQSRIRNDQQFIPLNYARRTTAEQARLHRGWFATKTYHIGNYDKANLPGRSRHEYGFAIDVALSRTANATEAVRALREVGFQDNVDEEPHHFEAVGARGHQAVTAAIAKITGPGTISYQYGENLVWLFEKCQQKQTFVTTCADLIRKSKPAMDAIRAKEVEVERLTRETQVASENYARAKTEYDRAMSRYELAKESAESYPRTWRCRAGYPIQQCTAVEHEPDRQAYRRELQRRIDEMQVRNQAANSAYQSANNAYRIHANAQQALLSSQRELQDLKDKHRAILVPIYQNDQRIRQAEIAIDAFRARLMQLEVDIAKYVRQNIP